MATLVPQPASGRYDGGMANGETRTEDEVERLRNQKELMELKAQIAALRAPWWRKAGLIATVTNGTMFGNLPRWEKPRTAVATAVRRRPM